MRLTVFTFVGIATLLMGCASGRAATGSHDDGSYYLQGGGPSALQSSAEQEAPSAASSGQRGTTATRQAVLATVKDVVDSPGGLADSRALLVARKANLGTRVNDLFTRQIAYGSNQLPWLNRALLGASRLAHSSAQLDDPDMTLGLLRLAGPRLEAAMFGSLLLAAWLDFLHLAELVVQQCPAYSVERLFMDLERVQKLLAPTLAALSSLEPRQVEAAAATLPNLMGQLSGEFHSIQQAVRLASERSEQVMAAAQLFEMLIMASTLKLSLPRLPPAAPVTLGVGLVMGTDGVLMGSRVVVSAEWVERMRRLVQAGVLSAPVVSAAVRIHAGQVLMAQSNQDLPKGVREALERRTG